MPIIEMPDGTELEFPEGMDRGKMREAIRSKYSSGNETGGDELIATAGTGAPDAIPAESPPTKRQLLDAGIKESQRQSKYYTGKANALDLAERSLDVPGAFKSLINLPNRLTDQPDYPPLLSPEQAKDFLNPFGTLPKDEVTQGLLKGGSEVVSGLTSPDAIAGLALAKKYPVPVSTVFAGETLGAIPEATRSLLESQTPGEAAERAVPTAANLLLTKLLANHLMGKPVVPPKQGPPRDIPFPAQMTDADAAFRERKIRDKAEAQAEIDQAEGSTPPTESPAPVTTATLDRLEAEGKAPETPIKSGIMPLGEKPKSIEPVREAQPEGETASPLPESVELNKAPKPPEATKAQAQVTKVAKTEGSRSAKEIKDELVARMEEAANDAPSAEDWKNGKAPHGMPNFKTIEIPGDGTFKILNSKEAISGVLKQAKRIATSPNVKAAVSIPKTTPEIAAQAESATKAYGSAEDAYRSVVKQREALQAQEPPASAEERAAWNKQIQGAEFLEKELYGNSKAGKLEAQAEAARDRVAVYKQGAEGFEKEITRLEAIKRKNPASQGRLKDLKERYAENQAFIETNERNAEKWEQQAAKEKAALEFRPEAKAAQEKQQPGLPGTEAPKAEAGTRIPPPEPGGMGASLGITGPLPPVNLDVGPIAAAIKGFAGHTLPKFTAKLKAAGEAGARYLSSKIAAPYNSILFSTKVLESGVDAKKFGAALTEDNLRSIRADFYREATDARNKGDHDLADELNRKAANVRSLIGARNSFLTEAEYQRFLHDPTTQEAIRVHKNLWETEIDPQYKKAQGLDPDLELPTRGLQTGARINLKVLLDDEPGKSVITAGRGSVLSTFRNKSPFAREAKGTGQRYEYDYNEIIANTFAKQLEIANQNDFHRILVENGLAKVAAKRPDMVAGEAPSRPYPLQRRLILTDGKAFAKNENLYLPQSLEAEYRAASNLDAPARVPFVKGFINLLNKGAIVSLSEATGHLWNLADAAFNLPKGKLLTDTLLKVAGRSDVVPTLFSVLRKSLADNRQQLAELATIGAMREHFSGIGPGNKVITWFDQTVRLILDDAYKGLRDSGLVENSETARREFVNQVGQYNTRAQGPLIRLLRDTGLGPFATAGRAFNVLGVKRMLLHPGVEASGTAASFALRANVLGSIVGFFVLRGVLNQVLSGNPNGRKGTRLMDVDLGLKDKTGKSMVVPLGDLLGPGRGARVTGVRGAVEAKRTGLNNAEAGDAAMRDIISSVISPAWGPAMRFGSTLIAGKQTPFSPQVAPQAKPGQNQFALNAGTAVKEANPFLSTGIDLATGKDVDTTKLAGRVAPQSRRTEEKEAVMPKIVDRAKTKDYKEWLIREAMKLPRSERSKFVNEHSKDAGFTERDKGDIQSRLRH